MLADADHDCDWLLIENDPGTIRWALFEKNLIGSPAVQMKLPKPSGGNVQLEIEINGGLGLTVEIKNVGDADATDVEWNITIDGGLFINERNISGTKTNLAFGESVEMVMSLFGIGLGIMTDIPTITVTAHAADVDTVEATATAWVICPFVILQQDHNFNYFFQF